MYIFSPEKIQSLASQLFVSFTDFYIKSYSFFTLPYQIVSLLSANMSPFTVSPPVFGLMAILLTASYELALISLT